MFKKDLVKNEGYWEHEYNSLRKTTVLMMFIGTMAGLGVGEYIGKQKAEEACKTKDSSIKVSPIKNTPK